MAVHRRAGRRRYVLLLLVLTSITLITLDRRGRDDGPLGALGRAAHTVVSPVEEAVDGVTDPVADWWDGITDGSSLKRENERLREQIEELEDERRRAQVALEENEAFRDLFELPILDDVPQVVARVVNRSAGNFEWTITLNKGSESGIAPDMPVVGPAGLVGRVLDAWDGGCKVLLLVDPDSHVSVRVLPGDVTGTADGGVGSEELRVELDAEAPVGRGDAVFTSGLENSVFPEGLSVGTVVEVEQRPGGLGTVARVQPATRFGALDFVDVLRWVPGQGAAVSTTTTTTTTAPGPTTTTGDGA
jgi:rod shape-determining protein MreC